jgi:hypothetical protein
MPHLYAYCDESGKHQEHKIVVFNALVEDFTTWERVSKSWVRLLERYQLKEFHAKKALRHSQQYGTMKAGNAEERTNDVLPFVREIVEGIRVGVVAAVDVAAYKLPSLHRLRLNISDDPHYFGFYVALSALLGHPRIPRQHSAGLILDHDEEKAVQCYRFLMRMRKANPEAKGRLPTICFMDSTSSPQLQAADLFSYLCRIHAEMKFLGKKHPYAALCESFERPSTGKERLEIVGGFYGERHLRDFMESKSAQE